MNTSTQTSIRRPPAGLGRTSVDRQWLNSADCLMLAAHDCMREMGLAGFQCQSQVWVGARIDLDRLERGLRRLALQYPVVCSRLVQSEGGPCWLFQPDAPVTFFESRLEGAADHAVGRYAEDVFERRVDLARENPIEFHLLRLEDGRDVFLLRWWHALMDGRSPEFVVQEIDRLADDSVDVLEPESSEDGLAMHLRRFPLLHRVRRSLRVVGSQCRLPVRTMTLMHAGANGRVPDPIRILVRTLSSECTQALTERVRRVCGFGNISAAIAASLFRTIHGLAPQAAGRRSLYQTDLPLNLRPPGVPEPIFHNFMSFIHLAAPPADLKDRDVLTRLLSHQMRQQLRRGIDLGNVQLMSAVARHPRFLRWHIRDRWRHRPLSVNFGYQGPVIAGLERLCDAPIERFITMNSAVAPPGLMIQANQFRGQLSLGISYVSSAIDGSLAGEFVERLEDDLLA